MGQDDGPYQPMMIIYGYSYSYEYFDDEGYETGCVGYEYSYGYQYTPRAVSYIVAN